MSTIVIVGGSNGRYVIFNIRRPTEISTIIFLEACSSGTHNLFEPKHAVQCLSVLFSCFPPHDICTSGGFLGSVGRRQDGRFLEVPVGRRRVRGFTALHVTKRHTRGMIDV